MKIIIVPDGGGGFSTAPPKTFYLSRRGGLALLAAAFAFAASAVYASAREIAAGWLESKSPRAAELVRELEARQSAENRRRLEDGRRAVNAQFAELRARVAELRAGGGMLAGRVGLKEDEIFSAAGDVCGEEGGGAEEELAHLGGVVSEFQKRYDVILRHGAVAALTYDTVPLVRPVRGRNWLSSRFGMRRDPFTGRRAFHAGYDYAARRGTPVLAAATGLVKYAGRLGNYGNAVRITHGGGVSTLYGHLHSFAVEPEQYVRRGEVIGTVGNTGRSTGPHLHYEVRLNNRPRPINGAVKKLRRARGVPKHWAL